jgi:hypothetical protein
MIILRLGNIMVEVINVMRQWVALYGGMILGIVFVGLFGFRGFSQLFNTKPESQSSQR